MALSAEQGMIRNITNRVIPDGIGAFDAELGTSKPQVFFFNEIIPRTQRL